VKNFDLLFDPALWQIMLPGVITAVVMSIMCSCLSVLVVLKRLSFIGQGISHAAFGGMGIAAVLGLTAAGVGAVSQFGIVVGFCLAAALIISWISAKGSTSADTAIGIVLVASMCVGSILLHLSIKGKSASGPGWESILFGSIMSVSFAEAVLACLVAAVVIVLSWWFRRPLIFWAFDEPSAPAFGVNGSFMRNLFLVLLCLAIVTAMKVSGVVLATAMLVLPAASALAISDRLWRVVVLAQIVGLVGVVAGIVASIGLDWPPGSSIVMALTAIFALARGTSALVRSATALPAPRTESA
jgi:ABC-type Mn2+/Zn2+ transport system permease subunit